MDYFRDKESKLRRNPYSYTDRGQYISKRQIKKMKKISQDPYVKITKHSLTSDLWNSNIGRSLLPEIKIEK